MIYLVVKTAISAIIIVVVSEVARRSAGLGALLASLPLVAVLSMIWLWRDQGVLRPLNGRTPLDPMPTVTSWRISSSISASPPPRDARNLKYVAAPSPS